jgi:hypothetical protein
MNDLKLALSLVKVVIPAYIAAKKAARLCLPNLRELRTPLLSQPPSY